MRKYILAATAAISVAVIVTGCKHGPDKRVTHFTEENGIFTNGKKDESLQAKVIWAKNKPKALDVNVELKNNSKKGVLLKVRNFTAEVGGEKALQVLPEFYIHLEPGDTRVEVFAFRFATPGSRSGPVKITMPVNEGAVDAEGKAQKPLLIEFQAQAVN